MPVPRPDPRRFARLDDLSIPTLPRILEQYRAVLARPDVELEELARLSAVDPPFAARVLRLANSAAFGQREPVSDLRRALVVVGARRLRNLVLHACVHRQFEHLAERGYDLETIWRHSLLVAKSCRSIAQRIREPHVRLRVEPDHFYTMGLLHDIGRLVLLDEMGEQYVELVGGRIEGHAEAAAREREILGYDHGAVGDRVLGAWNVPAEVREPLKAQHRVALDPHTEAAAAILRCADDLTALVQYGRPIAGESAMSPVFQNLLRLDDEDLGQVRDELIRWAREAEHE